MADIEVVVQDAIVKPVRTSTDHWFVRECATIMERAFRRPAILQPSSPASGTAHPFVEQCDAAIVGVGLTHHGARLHAPDENVIVTQFEMMSDAACSIFAMLAARASRLSIEPAAPAQSASGA